MLFLRNLMDRLRDLWPARMSGSQYIASLRRQEASK